MEIFPINYLINIYDLNFVTLLDLINLFCRHKLFENENQKFPKFNFSIGSFLSSITAKLAIYNFVLLNIKLQITNFAVIDDNFVLLDIKSRMSSGRAEYNVITKHKVLRLCCTSVAIKLRGKLG